MVAGAALSEDLTDDQWLLAIEDVGEEFGYFSSLGEDHAAVFIEQSQDVLFVAFETIPATRALTENGQPLAFGVCEDTGWSHLTILARRDSWFRDEEVYAYFDRLIDDAFFEEFEQVIFYGAGPCGYAAAAYSVAAPGAAVIAVAPQATLDRDVTEWDDRFPSTRRTDFTSRYGYAPDMLDAATAAMLFYDPEETEDSMHATLFRAENVVRLPYRRGRAGAIDGDFREMGLVSELAALAARGRLSRRAAARALRRRRAHVPYLRALLARTLAEDRPWLTAKLCRAVLARHDLPKFRRQLELAEEQLAAAARMPRPGDAPG